VLDLDKYERQFAIARDAIGKKSGKDGAETTYADTYQILVRLGARQQIGKKYRRPD